MKGTMLKGTMKTKAGIGALLVVLLIAVVACGSDDSSSSSPTTAGTSTGSSATSGATKAPAPGQPATWNVSDAVKGAVGNQQLKCDKPAPEPNRGVTDTSVKVGGLGTLSGATTATYGDSMKGAKARFARANAEGGVHGRKIEWVGAEDDGLQASQSVAAAHQLVDDQGVFAVVPVATSLPNYQEVLCEQVVPAIGWAFNTGLCNSANTFGYNGCLLPTVDVNSITGGPIATLLADSDDKSVAIIGVNDASAKIGVDRSKEGLEHAGLDVVFTDTSTIAPGTPIADPSPLVRDIMTSNDGKPPALVYHVTDFSNVMKMTQALQAAGYEGKQISAVGYDPRLADLEAFNGAYTLLQWLPYQATNNPTVKQMTADIEKYGEGAKLSLPTAIGWISADMFVKALEATGPNLTVDSFLDTLNGGQFTYGDGIFIAESKWPINHYISAPCGDAVQLVDGKYQLAVPLVCNDPYVLK